MSVTAMKFTKRENSSPVFRELVVIGGNRFKKCGSRSSQCSTRNDLIPVIFSPKECLWQQGAGRGVGD